MQASPENSPPPMPAAGGAPPAVQAQLELLNQIQNQPDGPPVVITRDGKVTRNITKQSRKVFEMTANPASVNARQPVPTINKPKAHLREILDAKPAMTPSLVDFICQDDDKFGLDITHLSLDSHPEADIIPEPATAQAAEAYQTDIVPCSPVPSHATSENAGMDMKQQPVPDTSGAASVRLSPDGHLNVSGMDVGADAHSSHSSHVSAASHTSLPVLTSPVPSGLPFLSQMESQQSQLQTTADVSQLPKQGTAVWDSMYAQFKTKDNDGVEGGVPTGMAAFPSLADSRGSEIAGSPTVLPTGMRVGSPVLAPNEISNEYQNVVETRRPSNASSFSGSVKIRNAHHTLEQSTTPRSHHSHHSAHVHRPDASYPSNQYRMVQSMEEDEDEIAARQARITDLESQLALWKMHAPAHLQGLVDVPTDANEFMLQRALHKVRTVSDSCAGVETIKNQLFIALMALVLANLFFGNVVPVAMMIEEVKREIDSKKYNMFMYRMALKRGYVGAGTEAFQISQMALLILLRSVVVAYGGDVGQLVAKLFLGRDASDVDGHGLEGSVQPTDSGLSVDNMQRFAQAMYGMLPSQYQGIAKSVMSFFTPSSSNDGENVGGGGIMSTLFSMLDGMQGNGHVPSPPSPPNTTSSKPSSAYNRFQIPADKVQASMNPQPSSVSTDIPHYAPNAFM